MPVNFGDGALVIDNTVFEIDSLYCAPEIEMSVDEALPVISLFTNTSATFHMNTSLLNIHHYITNPYEKFDIEYNINVKIQSRWHKKKRIRKKWLNRYGMKPDTILLKGKTDIEYRYGQTSNFDHIYTLYLFFP